MYFYCAILHSDHDTLFPQIKRDLKLILEALPQKTNLDEQRSCLLEKLREKFDLCFHSQMHSLTESNNDEKISYIPRGQSQPFEDFCLVHKFPTNLRLLSKRTPYHLKSIYVLQQVG
jgi:hypothetical protein